MIVLEYDNIRVVRGGEEEQPTIRIYLPRESSLGDYSCAIEVVGLDQDLKKDVFGTTKQQALCLAIGLVNYLILNSDDFENGRVFCQFADGSKEPLTSEMIGERERVEAPTRPMD